MQKYELIYNCLNILCIGICLCLFASCRSSSPSTYQHIKGETMGTYYMVTYLDSTQANHRTSIDSLLKVLNQSVSTYIPTSTISKVNQSPPGKIEVDEHFFHIFKKAKNIYQASNGTFDPTVMPLVNAWNFGYVDEKSDSSSIDSLLQFVDFESFVLSSSNILHKQKVGTQLDFSAIAKGYGVDEIANFLIKKGIQNYLVDIGGELRGSGINQRQQAWSLGIDRPVDSLKTRIAEAIVTLQNQAVATSGNYRNYRIENGQKYAHTINPTTGYSELSNLLSASIFASDCMTADAYATACMVMGFEKAKQLIEQQKDLEGLLIYSTSNGQLETYFTVGVNIIK